MSRLGIALTLALCLLLYARPAHAVLGMCTVTGTVYHVDGTPAANGIVVFRNTFTQTFGNDTLSTSAETVTLDSGGNLPAGVQVPLSGRIYIQVDRDKPAFVTVTNNAANCPIQFGVLYGAANGGLVIPSTVITSINTTNNWPGTSLTATNPVAAGPATLTLGDNYPITFGSSTAATELSGSSYAPFAQFTDGGGANGPSLQISTSQNASGANMGQIMWGSTTSPDTDKRVAGFQVLCPSGSGCTSHSFGAFELFVADNSGTSLGALGPYFSIQPPVASFSYNFNGNEFVQASNTNSGTVAQVLFKAYDGTNGIQLSQIGESASGFGAPYFANTGYINTTGTNGLLLYATNASGAIRLAANGQGAHTLPITEDSTGDFFLNPSNSAAAIQINAGNPSLQVISTTNASTDVLTVYPQNLTQAVGIWYAGIREEGSNGSNNLNLDAEGSGAVSLNTDDVASSSGVWSFTSLGTVNNHHSFSALNSGTQPSISSCNGTATYAMRAGSTDNAGEVDVTVTGTLANNCLINFGAGWGANPICNCNIWTDNGGEAAACATNTSTTQMNLWGQASITAGGHISWQCTGLVNGISG
jgi:hypothetical protein